MGPCNESPNFLRTATGTAPLMHSIRSLLAAENWLPYRRGLLIAIWLILVILTHIPVPQSVQGLGVSDKLIHLIGYFPLGLLLPVCRVRGCQKWWVCLLVIAGYGVLDELFQIPVGRTASVLDWVADVVGAGLGIAVSHQLTKFTKVTEHE